MRRPNPFIGMALVGCLLGARAVPRRRFPAAGHGRRHRACSKAQAAHHRARPGARAPPGPHAQRGRTRARAGPRDAGARSAAAAGEPRHGRSGGDRQGL
ncbi:MAG: hypothetical protein MZW92_60975 [Comamonadaceae bacterium]|nr:hypothetical protein [Comamonadaceae bacterium]